MLIGIQIASQAVPETSTGVGFCPTTRWTYSCVRCCPKKREMRSSLPYSKREYEGR